MTVAEVMEKVQEFTPEEMSEFFVAFDNFLSRTDYVSPEEMRLVDEAYERHLAHPEEGIPWEDLKKELVAEYGPF